MKNEFVLAFNEVLDDKQLPHDVVMEALEAAMISAYRKAVNASNAQHVVAKIDPDTGQVSLYAEKEIVEEIHDDRTEVDLASAKEVDPEAELGGMVVVETTPRNFGRVAAQTARQVIQQRIREAERDAQFKYFGSQVGEVVNGIVQASNPSQLTFGLDKKAEGIMPRNQQIGGERFRVHDRVRALLLEVKQTPRGPQIILSRAHRNFLRRLLEDEVPEIYHGLVEVRSIAREPGQRSKVAVSALQMGIDPVGACVGVRGVRIQAIVRELNDEKIDVIEWNADATEYIAKALSPARVNGVYLDRASEGTKTATVVVPEDQLSLAIGRDGQNARLAAKLTGWRIDIKSLPEAAADALYKLQNEAEYAELSVKEADIVPQIELIQARKSEGRPLAPEEYSVLAGFVDRVERRIIDQREEEKQAEKEHRLAIRATIPAAAFDTPLEDLGISPRYTIAISGEGYSTIGDLLFQIALDSDVILAVNGIGPKAMEEIEKVLDEYKTLAAEEEARKAEETAKAEALAAAIAEAEAILAAEKAAAEIAEAEAKAAEAAEDVPTEMVEDGVVESEETEEKPESVEKTAAARLLDDDDDEKPEVELDLKTIEEMFKIEDASEYVEDDEIDARTGKKKSKKSKRQYGEVIYDEDADFTYVKRKRKRGGEEWEEEW